jgi:GxxExxY protein
VKHKELTDQIIKAFYKVYNTLGYGFLEKVYERALFIELTDMGFIAECQKNVLVFYKNHVVGSYNADLTVESTVICELKTREVLSNDDAYQLLNYLKATTIEVGMLLNFGKKPEFKRRVYDNDKKTWINDNDFATPPDNTE